MEDLLLMQSPNQLVIIIACYLFTLKIGPTVMKYCQPFNLKKVLVFYNYSQIFFNTYILFTILPVAHRITFVCNADISNDSEKTTMLKIYYTYVLVKVYDLLDTIFFVLRKKEEQISLLHVYHHVLIFFTAWSALKYYPPTHYAGGPIIMFITVNCFVHAVMYTYYLKSAKGEVMDVMWKKCVTILQTTQHFIMVFLSLNAFITASDCPYPKLEILLVCVGFCSMAYLFSHFYYSAYIRKKEQPQMEESSKARVD